MKDAIFGSAYFGVVISIAGYALGVWLRKKTGRGWVSPLLICIIVVAGALLLLGVPYAHYNVGGQYISYLLTPATVCLAVPLYQQLALLKKRAC